MSGAQRKDLLILQCIVALLENTVSWRVTREFVTIALVFYYHKGCFSQMNPKFELSPEQSDAISDYVDQLKPGWLGRILYRLLPYRRQVVERNMRRVFADSLSEGQLLRLMQSFYRHLGLLIKEMLSSLFRPNQDVMKNGAVKGAEYAKAAMASGKAILVFTGHFGNWERTCHVAGAAFLQNDYIYIIRKPIKNRMIQNFLYNKSEKFGLRVINSDNMKSGLMKVRKERAPLVFVMDQRINNNDKRGIPVEFFGAKVGTVHALAKMAKKLDAIVMPLSSYRDERGHHIVEFHPFAEWIHDEDPEREIYLNTKRYNEYLERFILARPDQWLWSHKRWREIES